jgi:outer membrane receptor protein involved in Fe transport
MMERPMIKRVVVLGLVAAAGSAAADVPSSLRMRPRVAQAPADPAPPADPPPAEPAAEDGKTEVIDVESTTVEHQLFSGRAPISVVTRAQLDAAGRSTLGDILQALPSQANAANAQVNQNGDGTTRISLRGLGAARTLVLVNGRRMVNGGAGADASADLDAIPLPMIERVEILKDGASAIYGADAVGGVVNIITRPRFDGIDVSLLTGTSQRGDSTELDASFVAGLTANDRRSYVVVSGGFQGHDPVLASDRGFSSFQDSYDFASRTVHRFHSPVTPEGRLNVAAVGPGQPAIHPPGCDAALCRWDPAGGWTDFQSPRDDYNDATNNYLYTPSNRFNAYLTAGNKLTESSTILIEAQIQKRESTRQLSPVEFVADAPISKDSLYNPFGVDVLDYWRRLTELGPRQFIDDARTFRVVIGLTGEVPEPSPFAGWKYEISLNRSDSKSRATTTGQLYLPHVVDALGPSMLDTMGRPICVRTPGDQASQIYYEVLGVGFIPCVPVNLLAPGPISKEQRDQISIDDAGVGTNLMSVVHTGAGGRIAKLPNHGDLSAQLGADYRAEEGEQKPPSIASSANSSDNRALSTTGAYHTYEVYGELTAIPVAGLELARLVELDLGVRALNHSQFGKHLSYKAGGLFRTVQGLAARATYAKAFRAPSVRDTIGGTVERDVAAEDPCDAAPPSQGEVDRVLDPDVQARCTAQGVPVGTRFSTIQQRTRVGGNKDLKAETASSITAGVVYEPPQLPGVAFSADYWRIAIANAIETLGAQTVLASCYERGLDEFCGQIERDFYSHRISPISLVLQNLRRTTTSGFDLAARYDHKLGELGRLQTAVEAQYLLRYDLDTSAGPIHGVGFYDLGAYPRLRANLSALWGRGGASAGLNLRFVGSYQECAANDCNDARNLATAHTVDRYAKLDLFGGYEFGNRLGRTSISIGVNNVLDATPPTVYNAPAANSDPATYDFVGRTIYVRMAQRY